MKKKITYKNSGVNIDTADILLESINDSVKKTHRKEVIKGLGGFGGLYALPRGYHEPILVSSADGVGTKIRLAIDLKRYHTIGIDLVAMCVNDLIVHGAEPHFFLDYYATGKIDIEIAGCVIKSIATGCKKSGCALIGGETAEMPGIYSGKDYDIAGFCVGLVEKTKIIDGSKVKSGDAIIALGSSGLHSNGYSLIRNVLKSKKIDPNKIELENKSLADYLLEPTRIYVKNILTLTQEIDIHAIVHITGGGFWKNIPRVLPVNTQAQINSKSWNWPPIFRWLQQTGNITTHEMYRIFNCGVGMLIIIPIKELFSALEVLKQLGEKAWHIGKIVTINQNEPKVRIKR